MPANSNSGSPPQGLSWKGRFEGRLQAVWLGGMVLLVLGWTETVPPVVGWIGFGITVGAYSISCVLGCLPHSQNVSPNIELFQRADELLNAGDAKGALAVIEAAKIDQWATADEIAGRGVLRERTGDYAGAYSDFETALEREPENVYAMCGLIGILAGSPEEELRDGFRAVQVAQRACELTSHQFWPCLSLLAAGYAELGRTKEAVDTYTRAAALAPPEEYARCQKRLEQFRRGEPYRLGNTSE